jgi:hypothetical protein
MVVDVQPTMMQFREHIISHAIVRTGKCRWRTKTNGPSCSFDSSYTGLFCQEKRTCPPTFYGSDCSIQCVAPNTCADGHFYCNGQGERSCLDGWGPNQTCLQKTVAPIFDPDCATTNGCLNGGSCFNGSCRCPPSYTGKPVIAEVSQKLINKCDTMKRTSMRNFNWSLCQ